MMTLRHAALLAAVSALGACSAVPAPHSLFPAESSHAASSDYDEGFRLAHGIGSPRDYGRAADAYRRAAARGDALAKNNLGVLALEGHAGGWSAGGRVQSAVGWFREAAAGGSSSASYNLGLLSEAGLGMGASPSAAAYHYGVAAEQGHVMAQRRLAQMLEGGHGIPANPAESRRLLEVSAASGDAESIARLGLLGKIRRGEAEPMTVVSVLAEENCRCGGGAERGMASRGAAELRRMAAEGDASARYNLGVRLLNGSGDVRDPAEAARLFTLAARDGYAPAQRQIGLMHLRGQSVPRDPVAAHAWLNLAASQRGTESDAARTEMEALERTMTADQLRRAQSSASVLAR